jgi:hypothetical protein
MRSHVASLALAAAFALGCSPPGSHGGGTDTGTDAGDPRFLPDGAPNPCLGLGDCTSCTATTPCGWCGNRCLSGTDSQSFDGTCMGTDWMWRGVQCPNSGTQCPTHTDCVSCASDENSCGWCANTHQCVAGDQAGPASPVDGCSPTAGTWALHPETCH